MKTKVVKLLLLIFIATIIISLTGCTSTKENNSEENTAYNTWREQGNQGSETEFLSWIKLASNKTPEQNNNSSLPYDTWVKQGNKGTEAEFLTWVQNASIKAPEQAKNVNHAYDIWLSEGNKGSEAEFFIWTRTASRQTTNQRNEAKEAYNTWIKQGNKGTEADFLAWIKSSSSKISSLSKKQKEAYDAWVKQGNKGTEKDFLAWIKTASNTIVNLTKKQKEAYNSWITEGNKGTEAEFLAWIKLATTKMSDNSETKNVAYNTWLDEGNKGTETEFLTWIKLATDKMSNDDNNEGEDDNQVSPPEKPSIFDNVKFNPLTVVYDGLPHTITATGVPEGTEIYYSNNTATDAGTYKAFVSLTKNGETELLTAELTIKKADIVGVTFDDVSLVYDGTAKYIKVSDNVPKGIDVSYTLNDAPFNGATDVGSYNVTATLSSKNYNGITMNAKLTIEKANITDVTFTNTAFVYDGTAKYIKVSDNVPEGVNVSYKINDVSFNGATNVGNYSITAILSSKNYNTLTLEAILQIARANIPGITFNNVEFFEDGEVKNIFITGTLPDGVIVFYTLNEDPFLGIKEVGEYEITAVLLGDNYNTLTLNARLTIKKNKITGVTFTDLSVKYDGTLKPFTVSGDIPDGVTVTYKFRYFGNPFDGATDVGTYDVRATLTGPYHETLILDARLIIAPDFLNTVTGVTLVEEGNFFVLKWEAVPNAWNYQVNVYHKDQTFIETFNVERGPTSYDIERALLQGAYLIDDYLFDVVAVPSDGNTAFAPSLPSEKITYSHEGVLPAPENIRIEDGSVKWDAVPKAGVYGVRLHFCDNEGNVIRQIRGDYAARDLLPSPSRTLEQIKEDFSEITTVTPGYYRFSVRAVPVSPGTENSSNPMQVINRASGFTELTEPIWIE